jgi:DNA invertase Pin-like site-specific DNA recombinase
MAPTLLDGILERHEGAEPRVLTEDVRKVLRKVIRPGDDDGGESVALIAEKAGISTRTVYRVLQDPEDESTAETINLDLADRLCLAAGAHLMVCRLRWPDGITTSYF